MLLSELQSFIDQIAFPCSYAELMDQCTRLGTPTHIVQEIKERFEEEYGDTDEELDSDSFEEIDDYYEDDYWGEY